MTVRHYIAIDLGAESGRVMLGSLESGLLKLEEIHMRPWKPVHRCARSPPAGSSMAAGMPDKLSSSAL